MGVSKADINGVAAAALNWAYARGTEGYYAGARYAGLDIETGSALYTPEAHERSAFDQFAKAIQALRDAVQGEESKEAEAVPERHTIRTLEELDALPLRSVVLEDQYDAAYQKDGEDQWSGDGRYYDACQIDLPVTVIYEPGVGR